MVTKTQNSTGFAHIILISIAALLAVTIIGYLVYHQVQVSNERQLFAQADKEAQAFVNAIAAKYPGIVTNENSCSRTSAKYSEGFLGCSVKSELSIELSDAMSVAEILAFADEQRNNLPWQNGTTSTNNKYISPNNIRITVYKNNNLTCSVNYKYKDIYLGGLRYEKVMVNGNKVLSIESSCDGPAMAEYYK